ncbi:PREDICTED: vesicular glutamate transporter 1 [Ceratosolen solmsi marchali]|uniref:Vesicular glutamate transporter 1 n=1 Tax=Ceratosolen solmsi marchali TaxID=326594 RepID=A0AAJ7DX09_9HYME|nr:PREDICTED: vesicular glutamate transporter 1 [Ceratosolen solmsi marchali]
MSGFATAGLAAFDSLKNKASQKLSSIRRGGGGENAGYEEFEMPSEHIKENLAFEDETMRGFNKQISLDALPEPERPPLRHIDTYCMPECPCLSKRYTIALLACMGFIISFGMRCNMGMAKLKMSNSSENIFNWTVGTQSAVDSSFFWGYLVTQVPGGFLASLYPANRIFGLAIVISSFLNLLVPGALSLSPVVDMFVQVCKGLVEGVTYPACHGIWKYWAPPLERSRLATLAFCGSYAAVVIGIPLSGVLSNWLGWTASFYFYGIFGIIWYCFWLWLSFEKPSKHPCISARELRYIEDSLGQGQANQPMPTLWTTPWRKFFTSMPVYAIIVANFCRSWNFYLLVLFQGRFMHEAFDMPVVETGILGSVPHLLMTMIVPCGGLLADYLRKRGIMSTTNVRKLFNCGGFGMEAIFFLVVANCTTHRNGAAATLALTIGVACSGFAISGFNVNHLDIAPRYASILMGMSNGIGTIAGLLVPFFVDNITRHKDPHSWRNVFVTAACVHFVGVTFYAIFCSGELQPWADPLTEEKASWNPLDDLAHRRPPVPPPPQVMQTQFIRQPSLTDNEVNDWSQEKQPQQQLPPALPNDYQRQEKPIYKDPTISYGATEIGQGNPFVSTNPFASGTVNATYIQPATTDDYTHDVVQNQEEWQ